ncbi:hypothetical protein CVT26_004087 [Gymnopilus dilepis]|uniref:Uncharacterized protein n=1 Tax=Gymnopilus dilepis TaxID=231916 RepID=A0A409W2A4_9AGAR|nr:hypothetical protein CVT26_004087 [Gymnopilus dilepis]
MNEHDRYFISRILAFFAISDEIVNENLVLRFFEEIKIPEARHFYSVQIFIENIHAETYANLLSTLVTDPQNRDFLFHSVMNIPSIRSKAQWAVKWTENKDENLATRLVAFAAVEGIFFSASFAAIFWIKTRGIMPGLCYSNELISRDEGLHVEFACALFSLMEQKPSKDKVLEIITSAVQTEKQFVDDILSTDLLGMNAILMQQFVEFVADRLLQMLGHDAYYNVGNPFPFMEMISQDGKANFFERQVSAYKLSTKITPYDSTAPELTHIDFSFKELIDQ